MIHSTIPTTVDGTQIPSVPHRVAARVDALGMDVYTGVQTIAGHGKTHRAEWALVVRNEHRPRARYGACVPHRMIQEIEEALAELEEKMGG